MANATVDFLIETAHRFRQLINLEDIERQLTSDEPKDRRDSLLFSVYHLLLAAAVAEANIRSYLENQELPDAVTEELDEEDEFATRAAWAGTAFDNAENIIGGVGFMIVALFFFEGFCKLRIGEHRIRLDLNLGPKQRVGLHNVVDWLKDKSKIPDKQKLDAVDFLNGYRNAWHSFAHYKGKAMSFAGLELRSGQRLPIIQPAARIGLLRELFDVFLAVNRLQVNG